MDVKRIFRGPWFWIVIAVVGVLVALQYLAPNGGYDEIDTSEMSQHIEDGDIKDITFIDGADFGLDPIGVRGVGEIGSCGVAAAIANAIHHATGKRLRELPITPEALLEDRS